MRKALRTLRSRVGRVMRDVERQVDRASDAGGSALLELTDRTKRILSQKPKKGSPAPSRTWGPRRTERATFHRTPLAHSTKRRADAGLATTHEPFAGCHVVDSPHR